MKKILINYNLCEGCQSCSLACMQAHRRDRGTILNLDLNDKKYESRNRIQMDSDGNYRPLFCRHCAAPECVSACINRALTKDIESGLVFYKEGKCVSCFMCVMNCPYGILKPDQKTGSKVVKCDFCYHLPEGPSCVRSCPTGAIYVEEVSL